MKKLRAGLVALLVALASTVGVVITSSSAYALDSYDPNKPPPRVAPPAGTTTPNINKPLTKPMIPPGILGTAAKFLGVAGIGYTIGQLLRPMICGDTPQPNGTFTICPTAPPAPAPGAAYPVNDVPDNVWCVYNGGCKDQWMNFDPGIVQKDPPNNDYAQYNWTVTGFTAPSTISVHRTTTLGTKCFYPTNMNQSLCKDAATRTDGTSTTQVRGSCRDTSTGLAYAILSRSSGYTPAYKFQMQYSTGSGADLRKVGFNLVDRTPADGPICPDSTVLEWLAWDSSGTSGFYTGSNGVWRNPGTGNVDLNTVITSNLTCGKMDAPATTVTVSKTTPKSSGLVATLECPYGYTPIKGNTTIGNDLLTAPNKIDEWEILPTVREQYPQCIGWQAAGCKLMVFLDGYECTPSRVECRNWEEIERYTPSRLKCMWGPYQLDMSMCRVLRQSYIGETGTVSNPKNDPRSAPIAVDPWGKPLPQNPDPYVPAPGTTPGTTPGADPGTGTTPGGNPGPADIPKYNPDPNAPPGSQPGPGPSLTPGPSDTNCWPGGTAAFNPLEWVLQPVKCALSWAFVPKESVMQAQATRVQNSAGKVGVVGAIGTITTAVNTVGNAAGGSGCTGPTVNFDFGQVHQGMQPFNACSEPVATMAAISRAFTTVVVVVLGTLGMARAAGASIGFNFGMGKGGGS